MQRERCEFFTGVTLAQVHAILAHLRTPWTQCSHDASVHTVTPPIWHVCVCCSQHPYFARRRVWGELPEREVRPCA